MATRFLLKRYEVCLNPKLSLSPFVFNPKAWRHGKYLSELDKLIDELRTTETNVYIADNVVCCIFVFDTAEQRLSWKVGGAPHKEIGRLMRNAQVTNNTVNLYFDYEEEIDSSVPAQPNTSDIKRSVFNAQLCPYALAAHRDLLAAALKVQFPTVVAENVPE
jgi:hypothetical protein